MLKPIGIIPIYFKSFHLLVNIPTILKLWISISCKCQWQSCIKLQEKKLFKSTCLIVTLKYVMPWYQYLWKNSKIILILLYCMFCCLSRGLLDPWSIYYSRHHKKCKISCTKIEFLFTSFTVKHNFLRSQHIMEAILHSDIWIQTSLIITQALHLTVFIW